MRLASLAIVCALLAGCAGPPGPEPTRPADDAAPAAPIASPTSSPQAPGAAPIALELVASGFQQPLLAAHAGDGSGRLFVVEQGGLVKFVRNGTVEAAPFLDLRANVSAGGERGLLGLAFHPRFAENGLLFASYTDTSGDSVVERYRVEPGAAAVDVATAKRILFVDQPYGNHNGGHLAFGPDGHLYFGLGDGGAGGDPHGNGQDPHALLGSLLRIDIDAGDPYAVPSDNPYATGGGAKEVWAKGLRNPWRFTFDRETGDLFIGDVGQGMWEEIDHLPAGSPGGANFGWNVYEGAHRYDLGGEPFSPTMNPIAEYDHTDGSCTVVAGHVYRGKAEPRLDGLFLFGDYCTGAIFGLASVGGSWRTAKLVSTELTISSFGEDEAGEVYVVDHGGAIHKIRDGGGPLPPPLTDTL